MAWAGYLVFTLIIVAFFAVIIYGIVEKSKGHSILSDEPHLTKKDLVRLYKIKKKADEKKKVKEEKKCSCSSCD